MYINFKLQLLLVVRLQLLPGTSAGGFRGQSYAVLPLLEFLWLQVQFLSVSPRPYLSLGAKTHIRINTQPVIGEMRVPILVMAQL